jgi:hypothetical protein
MHFMQLKSDGGEEKIGNAISYFLMCVDYLKCCNVAVVPPLKQGSMV